MDAARRGAAVTARRTVHVEGPGLRELSSGTWYGAGYCAVCGEPATSAAEQAGGCTVERVGDSAEHARITFAEFPGRGIIGDLKAAGFWWGAPSWHGRAANIPGSVLALSAPDASE